MSESLESKLKLYQLLKQRESYHRYNQLEFVFPDKGPLSRDKYPKQLEFLAAGLHCRERAMVAANRSGKSFTAAVEVAFHLTGLYPIWWRGYRYEKPVDVWCAGLTAEATRDTIQKLLLGPINDIGSGLIPKALIQNVTRARGTANAIESFTVKHMSGGLSTIGLKSYSQGWEKFQGTEKHIIWLDEQMPRMIFSECLTRTAIVSHGRGMLLCTFTPLMGITEVVLHFLPEGRFQRDSYVVQDRSRYAVNLTWDDAPHLTAQSKQDLLRSYSDHERDARTKGIPSMGSGQIYYYPEEVFVVEPFQLPANWKRAFGMDVGFGHTAAVWGAIDPNTGVTFIYSEYYRSQADAAVHAQAVLSRGNYPGVIDYVGISTDDGRRVIDIYTQLGLNVVAANKSIQSGILNVQNLLTSGGLKIFNTCQYLLKEMRVYRRDEDGNIVKENDHLCDGLRYLANNGLERARPQFYAEDYYQKPTFNYG